MNNKLQISKEHLSRSYEFLQDSILTFMNNSFNTSINRAYYSVFHAMCACLCLKYSDFSKHSFIIAKFREEYIKSKIFDVRLSSIIEYLSDYRNDCDYNVAFKANYDIAYKGVEDAKYFYKCVTEYINNIKLQIES